MRIEWIDGYRGQQMHITAEEIANGFSFFSRESWDTCWVKVSPTPHLIAKASFFREAAANPNYNGPYLFHRKSGDDSVMRVCLKPGCSADQEQIPIFGPTPAPMAQEPARQRDAQAFHLMAAVAIVVLAATVAAVLHQFAAFPLTLAFAPLFITLLATFRLIENGHLTQNRFVKIVLEALKALPVFGRRPEPVKVAQSAPSHRRQHSEIDTRFNGR